MAPVTKIDKIEHTMQLQSQLNKDRLQYPTTHNYTWYTVQCFHPDTQSQKATHHQLKFMRGRYFFIVDGFQSKEQGAAIPSQTQLTGEGPAGNTTTIACLLISATNMFNTYGSPIPTPFTKINGMSNGHRFYMSYNASNEHVVMYNLGQLKTLFSH